MLKDLELVAFVSIDHPECFKQDKFTSLPGTMVDTFVDIKLSFRYAWISNNSILDLL